ncbi:MAG: hypothetical protein AMJ79_02930 [Phycisphaerae bacterium SM23_30]|nr:MAG: hypothetical protein AMJ79_02930 [Phycisphaerae bacterium SM23_30]
MKKTKILSKCLSLCIIFIIVSAGPVVFAQTYDLDRLVAELEPEIEKIMLEGKIPSAAVALVAGDQIIFSDAYGCSNLWARPPATCSTVYLIGSTFKSMSTYALLQQMEQGKFQLDDPVHKYLDDIKIQGQDPDNPVTFRHLLSHTSGLPAAFGGHPVWGDTVPPPLTAYLRKNLKVQNPPLTRVVYSNLAYTLVAHLVEKFSGVPYKEYMQKNIFDPLEMTDMAFAPRPDMVERLAIPYIVNRQTQHHQPAVQTKADVWPAGIVYGTIKTQAHWLIVNLNNGFFKGRRLLKEETVQQMMTRQYDQFAGPLSAGWLNETTGYGLTWWISKRNEQTIFAHSGSVSGYTAFLAGNREQKTGFAVLTNGNRAHAHLFKLAVKALDLMQKYQKQPDPQNHTKTPAPSPGADPLKTAIKK